MRRQVDPICSSADPPVRSSNKFAVLHKQGTASDVWIIKFLSPRQPATRQLIARLAFAYLPKDMKEVCRHKQTHEKKKEKDLLFSQEEPETEEAGEESNKADDGA